MKIVHISPTYFPASRYGGPIWSVHGLCRALAERGHDVEVYTTNVDGPGTSDVPLDRPVLLDGVRVRYFPAAFARTYWSPAMARALHGVECDVVHSHAVYLSTGVTARRAAHRRRTPLVISPRGMLVPELIREKNRWIKLAWLHLVERRNLRAAAAVHFTSRLEWEDASRTGLPLPSPFVVPNGVELRERPDVPRRPDLIVFLGRISWKKRLEDLIATLPRVPTARLVIAGNDDEELTPRLREIARTSGVADRIEFRGPVYGRDKDVLLATATLLALPSASENFGNVVLEALAMGTPVVMSEGVGVAPDVVEAGAGMKGLDSIGILLADPERCHAMGERGRRLVETRFSWSSVAADMERAYGSLARSERR